MTFPGAQRSAHVQLAHTRQSKEGEKHRALLLLSLWVAAVSDYGWTAGGLPMTASVVEERVRLQLLIKHLDFCQPR